jgi:small conductance mechanosensitive channel
MRSVLLLFLAWWALNVTAAALPGSRLAEIPSALKVRFHGLELFEVRGLGQVSAEDREQMLQERLSRALREGTPPFQVESLPDGPNRVLSTQGRYLATATPVDAQAAGVDIDTLAAQWSDRLEKSLQRAHLESTDQYYRFALWNSGWALLLTALLHALSRPLCRRYLGADGLSLRTLMWLCTATYCLHQFPQFRDLSHGLYRFGVRPLMLLLGVTLGAGLASWLARRVVRHYFLQTERFRSRKPQSSPRWRQRLHMLRDVGEFAASATILLLAITIYFSLLDLNLGAILAGAGFLGVALGFAAQDVLKDYVAGLNIMVEDQFGAGDIVTVGEFTGEVEHFTLRVTQLRDLAGNLTTLPNSQIKAVQNLSNLWSQVDLRIPVALGSDYRLALKLLEETANGLRQDWPDRVLSKAEVLGIESIGAYFVELRMLLRTAPQQQFPVRRELLLRALERFAQAGVEIPVPVQRLFCEERVLLETLRTPMPPRTILQ